MSFQTYIDKATANGDHSLARRLKAERQVCYKLIDLILADGNMVSHTNGEEWEVIRSTDRTAIRAAFFATDEETVVARAPDGTKLGWFALVYGNDGYDVISDYSANEYGESIWQRLQPLADRLEAAA